MAINFIWVTTGEVIERALLYKSQEEGGLGAMDLGLKLKNIWNGLKQTCHLNQRNPELDQKERAGRTINPIF